MALRKCSYCHSTVSDKAKNCPHCGSIVSRPYKIEYRNYIKSPISENYYPKSWLIESLLLGLASLILFTIWCLPFAIASFIHANRVENLWRIGDIDGATKAAEEARKYYKIGLWLGIGTWGLILLGIFLLLFVALLISNK